MHWYAALLVYFHWSLLNWRNSVAYSFCWYMNQLSLFYFVLFCFSRPDYRDILLWYLKYGVWFFCRQVLLTCPNVFVVLKIKISWFLILILNQCLLIVDWTIRKKLQWNFNRNRKLFILPRGRWVNAGTYYMIKAGHGVNVPENKTSQIVYFVIQWGSCWASSMRIRGKLKRCKRYRAVLWIRQYGL